MRSPLRGEDAERRRGSISILQQEELLGIAIDESTALIVSGGVATVMGKSKVALYDSRLWKDQEHRYFFLEKGQRSRIIRAIGSASMGFAGVTGAET